MFRATILKSTFISLNPPRIQCLFMEETAEVRKGTLVSGLMKALLQCSGQKEHFQDFLSSPVLEINKLELMS